MGIKKQILQQMTEIVDFSYAWIAIDRYLVRLQETITASPKSVLSLKTLFLKMSTIMENPLRRIAQANSEDFESVAKYYSGQLLKFIKSVLYVIPINIFKELDIVS
jgi:WASH complex subunit strumpellin